MGEINRVALVTGASRGIGRACVLALAEPDIMLYVNDVANLELAAETCDLAKAKGARAEVLPFNVAVLTRSAPPLMPLSRPAAVWIFWLTMPASPGIISSPG